MRVLIAQLSVIALAVTLLSVSCQSANAQAVLTAYHTDAPPELDGVLSDACWQAASVTSHFISAEGAGLPDEQTQVRICWDDANLYVGVEAFEANLEPRLNMLHMVKAEQTGRDANVFSDDCIEVFLQPPGDTHYHFAANSGAGTYEARNLGEDWDCEWQCIAKRGSNSYILEMAIPLAALGGKPEGEWRANFCRERTAVKEFSTWSGLQGAFHQPDGFGTLRFAQTGPALTSVSFTREGASMKFAASVGAAGGAEAVFEARVAAGEQANSASAKGDRRQEAVVAIPQAALETGRVTVGYLLQQGDDLYVRSADIPQAISAGAATLALASHDATATVHLNGASLALKGGKVQLELSEGLNVLAIEAEATGAEPSIAPRIEAAGCALPRNWLARGDTPAADWREALSTEGWSEPARTVNGLWAQGTAKRACFVRGLYVGERGPQLFPKMDTFYMPRGGTQLMKLYLHKLKGAPTEGYRMAVAVPAALKYKAVEPLTGSAPPEVTLAETYDQDGVTVARYLISYDMLPGQGIELSMRWGNTAGTTLAYEPTITAGGTFDWRHLSMVIKAPRGAVSAHPLIIKWQKRGITGTCWLDNLVFREKDSDENLLKMGTFDEPEWGKHWILKPEGPDGSKCVKIVATAELVDRQQALWVDKDDVIPVQEGREYVVEMDVRCDNMGSPHGKPLVGLLFEDTGELVGEDFPILTYCQTLNGLITELPQRSRLVILPPLKNVRPEYARIAPCYSSSRFKNPEVAEAYADNCWASGITWTWGRSSNKIIADLMDRGSKLIYHIGYDPWTAPPGSRQVLEERPELQALDFEGKRIKHRFCPTWMLTEGGEVIAALEEWLLDTVSRETCFGINWDLEQPVVDPPTFCTCERCQAAFREFAGLVQDTKLNPDTILKQYREEWTDFRCTQNAELAGHIKRILSKAKRPIEFSLYSGYQTQRTKEHYGVDWKLMAPHLDLGIAGYGGDRKRIFDTLEALGDVPFMGGEMWYLSDRDDARPMPRMETWRNRILRQFMDSGGNGCLIWWLPPMDGGAFYATSEAAEIIAKHEGFFKLSQRCDAKVKVTGVDARHWAAFERDGRILAVLLNFKAEALQASVEIQGRTYEREIEPYGVWVVLSEAR